jgi:hypothetical protein
MNTDLFAITDEEIIEVVNALSENGVFSAPTKRRRRNSVVIEGTVFGCMLADPRLQDPTSSEAALFRRRFRVPYQLFVDVLVPLCKERNVFEMKKNSTIPVEHRILVVLSILGRGECGDVCMMLSGIGASTCYSLLHRYVGRCK